GSGMFPAFFTCRDSPSIPIPARTWHAFRSIYVPGQPQHSHPGTNLACFPLFLRAWIALAEENEESGCPV
ncbi:MAG: hypothetical protein IIY45_06215, partial [Firmicutes bacterium]|nr:hypothetical protein [Bacillota bacterium]